MAHEAQPSVSLMFLPHFDVFFDLLLYIATWNLFVLYSNATVKPDSSFASRGMKTYSESRIELRNLQILKKVQEKSSQFLSLERPCGPKSLDVALKITGVEKISSENLWLRST